MIVVWLFCLGGIVGVEGIGEPTPFLVRVGSPYFYGLLTGVGSLCVGVITGGSLQVVWIII